MSPTLVKALLLLGFTVIATAGDKPPDISAETEASYHKYVDHVVVVRGRLSLYGKVGPFIDTGKAVVYLKPDPESAPDFAAESEGKAVVVIGTLRYQPAKRSDDPAKAGVLAFFYLAGDCAFLKPGVL